MPLNEFDIRCLERALELAERGWGCTYPNPLVGAVLAREGAVLGEGYHAALGTDHAEVAALRQVADATEATAYVTLEPCCCYGRTPPCTTALIQAGVARVVVGVVDPSPQVDGRGLARLREAGIVVEVAEGELARRCRRQNNGFRKHVVTGLPFVSYKYAMTLDGRVSCDSGDSRWVSGEESRALVHHLRSGMGAVVVGAGTLRADDPLLTVRTGSCRRQPLRVVIDGRLTIRQDAALVQSKDEGPVLVVCSDSVEAARRREVESWGVETAAAPEAGPPTPERTGAPTSDRRDPAEGDPAGASKEQCLSAGRGEGRQYVVGAGAERRDAVDGLMTRVRLDPRAVVRLLGRRGVQSVMLEGGPRLAGSWWSAGVVDQVIAFISPRLVSGSGLCSPLVGVGPQEMAEAVRLREVEQRSLGSDLCISGYVGEPY